MPMRTLLLLVAGLLSQLGLQAQQGYQLTIHFKDYTAGKMYLANYMGKSIFLADSAEIDAGGKAVLKGTAALPGGIYLVVFPGKQRYFEILLDKEQTFSISADSSDLVGKTVYKTSADNEQFLAYNRFLASKETISNKIQEQLSAAHTATDSAAARPLQVELNKQIQQYRDDVIGRQPKTLLAAIFRAMKEPEVPAQPAGEDSTFGYRYYKAHYWDSVDLSDGRLVRTPILDGRLQKYFTQLVVTHPDSIVVAADELIARTRKDKEMFKYVLWWLTYHYETSPYMGMDAVFVHLVEKYYVPGDAYWLNREQVDKIIARAYSIAPNLIGQQAPPLDLKDTTNTKVVSLYKTQAKYTVLVFWDPTCGHCKTEIPKLDSAFRASWQQKNVAIIGVKTEGTQQEWMQFIQQHRLKGWIHAWDPKGQSNYRRLYDVYSTPVVYLLDEKKKIIAKRLGVEQLGSFLDRMAK